MKKHWVKLGGIGYVIMWGFFKVDKSMAVILCTLDATSRIYFGKISERRYMPGDLCLLKPNSRRKLIFFLNVSPLKKITSVSIKPWSAYLGQSRVKESCSCGDAGEQGLCWVTRTSLRCPEPR